MLKKITFVLIISFFSLVFLGITGASNELLEKLPDNVLSDRNSFRNYEIIEIDVDINRSEGDSMDIREINDAGSVVGWINDVTPGETYGQVIPFIWADGSYIILNLPEGSNNGLAKDINSEGDIVGWSGEFNAENAVKWNDEENPIVIEANNQGLNYASGINDLGFVVGASGGNAFVWNPEIEKTQYLESVFFNSVARKINNNNVIVGQSRIDLLKSYAVRWVNEEIDVLGLFEEGVGTQSDASDINNQGVIVGYSNYNPNNLLYHAFIWNPENRIMFDMGTIDDTFGASSYALAINDFVRIVGASEIDGFEWRAFLWENGEMKDLNDLIPQSSGWVLRIPYDINNHGQIIGEGILNNERRFFLLDPI